MKPKLATDVQSFRKVQMAEYRLDAPGCEVTDLLRPRSPEFTKWLANHCLPGYAIHHIAGRTGMVCEYWSNYIMVGTAAHEWSHQSFAAAYSVPLAFEACCLWSKNLRQQKVDRGPSWQQTDELHRQHWSIDGLNAVRACCVAYKTIRARVEFLAEQLDGTSFSDICDRLLEVTNE